MDSNGISGYTRVNDVITGALIVGTWATYQISQQSTASSVMERQHSSNAGQLSANGLDPKLLLFKVCLPLLGLSLLSTSGILLYPLRALHNAYGEVKKKFWTPQSKDDSNNSAPSNLNSPKEVASTASLPPAITTTSTVLPPISSPCSATSSNSSWTSNTATSTLLKPVPSLTRHRTSVSLLEDNDDRDVEILVHNVSHSDVVISLSTTTAPNSVHPSSYQSKAAGGGETNEPILARPCFSSFNSVVSSILEWIGEHSYHGSSYESEAADTIERNSRDAKHSFIVGSDKKMAVGLRLLQPCPLGRLVEKREDITKKLTFRKNDYERLQAKVKHDHLMNHGMSGGESSDDDDNDENDRGFMSGSTPPPSPSSSSSSVGNNKCKMESIVREQASVVGVFFPLIATILPVWIENIKTKHGIKSKPYFGDNASTTCKDDTPKIRKIIFLISGEGVPRSEHADSTDNSTASSAVLLEDWIKLHYPFVKVIRIHSRTNLFRYDENIAFVKKKLLPKLEPLRDQKANKLGEKWPDAFKITLSFASGSPARLTAIQASLRNYRPEVLHVWQRKTFWEKSVLCLDDIEPLSANDLNTLSAERIDDKLEGNIWKVVQRLIKLKNKYKEAIISGNHDFDSFWHRKSKKVVLSVLLVEKEELDENGEKIVNMYDGTNMEVSMPTGSLCAERNAIGSALSDDLSLKRTELKIIAVLGFSLKAPKPSPASSYASSSSSTVLSSTNLSSSGSNPIPPPFNLEGTPRQQPHSLNTTSSSGSGGGGGSSVPISQKKHQDSEVNITPRTNDHQNTHRGKGVTSSSSDLFDAKPPLNALDLSPPATLTATETSPNVGSGFDDEGENMSQAYTGSNTGSNMPPPLLSGGSGDLLTPISTVIRTSLLPLSVSSSPSRTQVVRAFEDEKSDDDDDDASDEEGRSDTMGGSGSNTGGSTRRPSELSLHDRSGDKADISHSVTSNVSTPMGGVGPEGNAASFRISRKRESLRLKEFSPGSPRRQNVSTPAQTAVSVKVHDHDMNPLKPCGSCSEWLKKIAEVNPSFKVLSFTDEECAHGVFIESIFDT